MPQSQAITAIGLAATAGALARALWQTSKQGGASQSGRPSRRGFTSSFDSVASPPPSPPLTNVNLDLRSLDSACPQLFYLPDITLEKLADCYAVVEGVRLPLHNQLLAAQAIVLRTLFVAQAEEGGVGAGMLPQEPAELSSAFSGCTVAQVATFLRFTYSPDHATAASLHAVQCHQEGLLAAVAGLAHRLDAAGLLAKIEAYLQGASASASIPQLLDSLQLAESCHLSALSDTCISLLATELAAAGPFWREQVSQEQLAACNSDSLASLACKMAGGVHAGAFSPPQVHGREKGLEGAAGGFTWVIPFFSKQQGRVTSPWVEVGGVEWRLKVWPRGDDAAGGTHLSAYLECNHAHAAGRGMTSVESHYEFSFLDQAEESLHYTVDCGKDMFTATTQNWGKTRMMPLAELARADRSYLTDDRLAVRISIRVLPRTAAAAAMAAEAAEAAGEAAADDD